jgi:hypothetical protein
VGTLKALVALTTVMVGALAWGEAWGEGSLRVASVLGVLSGGDPLGLGLAFSAAATVGLAAAVLRREARRGRRPIKP